MDHQFLALLELYQFKASRIILLCLIAQFFYYSVNAFSVSIASKSTTITKTSLQGTATTSSSTDGSNLLFVGFDLGTSGARISIIEGPTTNTTLRYKEVFTHSVTWDKNSLGPYDDPNAWMDAIYQLFAAAKDSNNVSMKSIRSICFSGTSSSCLLVQQKQSSSRTAQRLENKNNNEQQRPIDLIEPTRGNKARMYNYNVNNENVMEQLKKFAPSLHTTISPTSSLAKLLAWNIEQPVQTDREMLCHQADYVARQFISPNVESKNVQKSKLMISSDWHNCLKLGYDVRKLQYPSWLIDCIHNVGISASILPNPIVSPGDPIGIIRNDVANYLGLSSKTIIVGGTTDSNAAFFAATSGQPMIQPGIAVTSLGSTLAIKQLSSSYVEDASRGVYSHRFPSSFLCLSSSNSSKDVIENSNSNNNSNDNDNDEAWLVGGASNVGCTILRELQFSNHELEELSKNINPSIDSPLQYYPLTKRGERFPIADPNKEPIVTPVPTSRTEYLHGILQGISYVERDGYVVLGQLGAKPKTPAAVLTCGGGSRNPIWTLMRQRILQQTFYASTHDNGASTNNNQNDFDPEQGTKTILVSQAENVEASYGAAILAAISIVSSTT